jgi:hypothetical protein
VEEAVPSVEPSVEVLEELEELGGPVLQELEGLVEMLLLVFC